MGITSTSDGAGITTVTVDYPPVNAIPSAGWFELADAVLAAGKDPDTHVVILRSEGRGFNAGVDIKEMQATEGFDALIAANHGCAAAFSAVYDCEVPPVVVAVNGFCVGGGIGLVGNATSSSLPTTRSSVFPRWTAARSAPPPTSRGWCRST